MRGHPRGTGPLALSAADRTLAARFAALGSTLPVAIATVTDFGSHHALFFLGAALAAVAPLVVTTVSRRHRVVFYAAAYGGIPALTLMQSYSGGVNSGYAVLSMMAMVWFGLQAGDRELVAALVVFAACCFAPMITFGPPAYQVSWGHAAVLLVIGCTVAASLRALSRQVHLNTIRLQQEATVDDLTGLLNRRGWRQAASQELARAARTGLPVALAMLDLDALKLFNDRAGHAAGDRLLADTGQRIRETLRAGDVVARVGGDELAAMLSNTTADGAVAVVERLRARTPRDAPFSVGIALWDGEQPLAELLHRADRALYEAKACGGARTAVAPPKLVSTTAAGTRQLYPRRRSA